MLSKVTHLNWFRETCHSLNIINLWITHTHWSIIVSEHYHILLFVIWSITEHQCVNESFIIRLQTSDFRFQLWDFRLQLSYFSLQTSDFSFHTFACSLHTSIFKLQTAYSKFSPWTFLVSESPLTLIKISFWTLSYFIIWSVNKHQCVVEKGYPLKLI